MTAYTQTLATDSCCICNGVAPSIWKQVGKNLTKQEVSVRTLQKSNKKILNSQEITSRTIRRSQTKTFNRSEISTATMAKRSGKQIITDSCMICNGVLPWIYKKPNKIFNKQEILVGSIRKTGQKVLFKQEITNRNLKRLQSKTLNRTMVSILTVVKKTNKRLITDSCTICNGVFPWMYKRAGKVLNRQESTLRSLKRDQSKYLRLQETPARTLRRSQTKTFTKQEVSIGTVLKRPGKLMSVSCFCRMVVGSMNRSTLKRLVRTEQVQISLQRTQAKYLRGTESANRTMQKALGKPVQTFSGSTGTFERLIGKNLFGEMAEIGGFVKAGLKNLRKAEISIPNLGIEKLLIKYRYKAKITLEKLYRAVIGGR